MPRARTRIPGFLLDHAAPPTVSALTEFYREEFLKHHQCLQAQREYFSAQAIENAENALLKIIADLDRLSEEANAERRRRTAVERVRRRDRPLGLVRSQQGSLTVPVSRLKQDLDHVIRAGVDAVSARRVIARAFADPEVADVLTGRRPSRRRGRQGGGGDGDGVRGVAASRDPAGDRDRHARARRAAAERRVDRVEPSVSGRAQRGGRESRDRDRAGRALRRGARHPAVRRRIGADGVADRRHLARRQDRRRRG